MSSTRLVYQADLSHLAEEERESAMKAEINGIGNRLKLLGLNNPVIEREGTDRLLVDLPKTADAGKVRAVIGPAILEFGELTENTGDPEVKWENSLGNWKPATGTLNGEKKALTSAYFKRNTRVTTGSMGEILLTFDWDADGSVLCQEITGRMVANHDLLGLFYGDTALKGDNGQPITPAVYGIIYDSGQIEGLSRTEAATLSELLNLDRLPVPLTLIYENGLPISTSSPATPTSSVSTVTAPTFSGKLEKVSLGSTATTSGGTCDIVLSNDHSTIVQVSLTLYDVKFSISEGKEKIDSMIGKLTKTQDCSIPVMEGSFSGAILDGGELKGKITSDSAAQATLKIILLEYTTKGSVLCDFGTWNWSATLSHGDSGIKPGPAASPDSSILPAPTVTSIPTPANTSLSARYAIVDKAFEAKYKGDCNTDCQIKDVKDDGFVISVEEGGGVSVIDGRPVVWGWGAKHTWLGKLTYAGYTFDSYSNDPLQFTVDKDKGYVYIKGTGTITLPDGRVVKCQGATPPLSPTATPYPPPYSSPLVTPTSTPALQSQALPVSPVSHVGLYFNSINSASPFVNSNLRMAIEYAIDKTKICDVMGNGTMIPLYQFLPSGEAGYNTGIKPRDYNLDKAKQLLIEAGYPNGFKAKLYFDTEFMHDAPVPVAIQGFLAQAGIDVILAPLVGDDLETKSQTGLEGGAILMTSFPVGSDKIDAIDTYFASTSMFVQPAARPSGLDALIKQAKAEKNAESQNALCQIVYKMIYDNAMYVPLWLILN
jgi:hypothetical protein